MKFCALALDFDGTIAQHDQLDPEGDDTALEALPGVTCFGGAEPLPRPRDLLRALRYPDMSVVIDLSHTPQAEKLASVRSVLPGRALLRRHTGLPHRVVVNEAHYSLHESEGPALVDLGLNGYTLTTHRASRVHPALLRSSQAILVTRESDPIAAELREIEKQPHTGDATLSNSLTQAIRARYEFVEPLPDGF